MTLCPEWPLELQLVADGLSFPTSLAFDEDGCLHVATSGLAFGGAAPGGRVLRVEPDGRLRPIAAGLAPPVNGLVYDNDCFYASEGGPPRGISRIERSGRREFILEGMPGPGNYHVNMAVAGPDGRLYFSQGAMTNTGVMGLDAYELGWLRRLPHAHDIPGYDVVLRGFNAESRDPFSEEAQAVARTGAFVPFGTATMPEQRIPARVPCTAAVLRCNPDGAGLEVVAWGLRNAYGLGFLPDGRLLAMDQGADDRGSRPIGSAPDLLYEVRGGAWYGWPDFIGGDPVTDERYRPARGPDPCFLLSNHDALPGPERALLHFPPHAAAAKFAVLPRGHERWPGQLLVALFGDEKPMTAPAGPRAGRAIVRVDPADWSLHPVFLDGLRRPIDVAVCPRTEDVYILDFGSFEIGADGVQADAETGAIYRLARRPAARRR